MKVTYNNLFIRTIFLLLVSIAIGNQSKAQVVMSFPGGIDNCTNPLPNAGTYSVTGTVNGKNEYAKSGGNPRIQWTGSQWEWQADDPTISGINYITCYFNTFNTSTPPADCWQASFGCFLPAFSGADAYPVVSVSSIDRTNTNPTASTTVNYTVTFSGTINSLTSSNFSLTTSGVSGASISSVSQTSGSVWNVAVNTGTGDGSIRLNMVNSSGASAIICTLPYNGQTYTVSKTSTSLSATQSQTNLSCSGVCIGTATVSASGGTSPYTYSWSPSGGTSATASGLCAGNYSCTITDNVSATITKNFTIIVGSTPEINVQGNGTTIADGDATPTTADHTDFGNQQVCSGAIERTFTIQNTGTSNLTLTSIIISGTHSTDYSITGFATSPVGASASTTFKISFNPTALGVRNATITIANDDCDESSYDFAIQGTGTEPEINVQGNGITIADGDATPTTADHTDFGSQVVCSGAIERTFTIQNTGTSDLTLTSIIISGANSGDFSITGFATSPVGASASTTFKISFNPSALGVRNAIITIANSDCDESSYDFAIEGTGIDPEINVQGNSTTIADGDASPTTTDHTDFGTQTVCTGTIERTFTIQNTGTTNLTLTSITISGANSGDFSITGFATSPVAASASTTFKISFNPTALGVRNAIITIANSDCDESSYDFAIRGTWVDPEINVQGNSITIADGDATATTADHTDFGSQVVCSGAIERTFTIQNTGTSNLTLTSIIISGTHSADYSITGFATSPVGASASTTFKISFNPSALGVRNATITIANDDCNESSYDFAIQGTGTEPEINVQGNSTTIADGDASPTTTDHTDFGTQTVCTGTIERTYTIQNTGTSNLTLTSIIISGANSGDFSITGFATSPVAASASTTFKISFNPTAPGVRNAIITIANSDCDESSYDFAIRGTWVDPEINVQGNSTTITDGDATPTTTDHTDFGSQVVCSGAIERTFTIQNTGTSNLTLTSIIISGANSGDFSITGFATSPVGASASTTFKISFNPSALGVRNATITIANDDCNESSYDFAIQGTGTEPEINVQGNSTNIADGDATPETADHTDFGTVNTSSGTMVRTFTIQNSGTSNLTLTSIILSGAAAGDYSITGFATSPVGVSGSTTFQITFNPSALGVRNATITISNSDCDEASYDFAITGTGANQEINVQGNSNSIVDGDNTPSLTDHTKFGDIAPSTSFTRTYTIQNTGSDDLTISSIALSGTDASLFSIGTLSYPFNVSVSSSVTFTVTFTPSSGGLKNAIVTVSNNDDDEATYDFTVQGERNCYSNSIAAKPTNDGVNTGGIATNIYLGYGAQKDTLKALGFGSNTTWSPATYLSCTACSTTIFTATTAGSFTYTANNGCISNSITIVVKDVRYSGSGTTAKVVLCHYNTTTKQYQNLAVLTRGISSHFQYDAKDYLGTCNSTSKRTNPYSDLVIDENELEVICSPNPFSQTFTLNYNSSLDLDATIFVYGMTGNLLEKTTVSGLSNEVKLGTNLPDGIYYVSFNQGNTKKVFRVIKIN